MTQEQLQQLLIDWINANKRTSNHVDISADTELLGSGILDSFGFLDLIVHVESKTGLQIDLADADPDEFAVVRGLCNLALKNQAAQPCPGEPGQTDRGDIFAAGARIRRRRQFPVLLGPRIGAGTGVRPSAG